MLEGMRYRVEGRKLVRHGEGHSSEIYEADSPTEVEAMLHGLTLPQLVRDVRTFNERFGLPRPAKSTDLDDKLSDFRYNFMVEELEEYNLANCADDRESQLDALVDLVYVAIGTAVMAGWDFEEAWRRVHAANMKKVPAKSADESKRGHALDVVKPVGWVAPDLSDLVK